MKPPLHKVVVVCLLGALRGLWEGIGKSSHLIAAGMEAGIKPHLHKLKLPEKTPKIPGWLAAIATPGGRPFRYSTVKKVEDIVAPGKVLQEKKAGVLVEIVVGKDGKAVKAFHPRGEKVDFLPALPDLKDKVLDKSVWNSKLFVEVCHPNGENWVNGVLHSKPDVAAASIKEHGHPQFFVLKVDKLGGFDVSTHKYPEARPLAELVAGKLPHGAVPEQCDGTDVEKRAFIEKVRKDNEGKPVQACDGVVAYPKDTNLKNAKLERLKNPVTGKFVIMGFKDSDKMKDAVASLEIGDGQKKLGKVNVADPGMRTTIRLNPDRYLNKSVVIEYTRQTKKGALVNPVLRRFLFAEPMPTPKPAVEVKKAV